MQQQSPTRYYIVKADDQPVVRSIPVRPRPVRAVVAASTEPTGERKSLVPPKAAVIGLRAYHRGPARVAHLVRHAVRRRGAGR